MNAEWFAPRPMTSNRCRGRKFWGQNKTAPGRGGGPGACLSEALGGIRARRGDGAGFKRTWSSPLLESEDGDGSPHPKMRITHAFAAKTHMPRGNQFVFA